MQFFLCQRQIKKQESYVIIFVQKIQDTFEIHPRSKSTRVKPIRSKSTRFKINPIKINPSQSQTDQNLTQSKSTPSKSALIKIHPIKIHQSQNQLDQNPPESKSTCSIQPKSMQGQNRTSHVCKEVNFLAGCVFLALPHFRMQCHVYIAWVTITQVVFFISVIFALSVILA